MAKRLSHNQRQGGLRRSGIPSEMRDSNETIVVLVLGGFVISTETHSTLRGHLSAVSNNLESVASANLSSALESTHQAWEDIADDMFEWDISAKRAGDCFIYI